MTSSSEVFWYLVAGVGESHVEINLNVSNCLMEHGNSSAGPNIHELQNSGNSCWVVVLTHKLGNRRILIDQFYYFHQLLCSTMCWQCFTTPIDRRNTALNVAGETISSNFKHPLGRYLPI